MPEVDPISSNQLLSALPISVCQRLKDHLEVVSLIKGQILHQSDRPIQEIYFPENALISVVLMLSDKSTTEVGSIGKNGIVGLPVILGCESTISYSIVQISGLAVKFPADIIKREFDRGEELHDLLLLYTQVQLNQISQIAACKSHHNIEQRFARWLLLVCNFIGQDTLYLTQQSISQMLGVRRASVTEVAISLQKAGIIHYNRGQISILDFQKLEKVACECYGAIKNDYARLLKDVGKR